MTAFRMLIVLSLLTGLLYTMVVTAVGHVLFPRQTQGSLVTRNGQAVGSELLAQRFMSPRYFWPRPSSADFATVPSGASNKGPTSEDLRRTVITRIDMAAGTNETAGLHWAPRDLLYSSGSGIDPHISPEVARFQIHRVAVERQMPEVVIAGLVTSVTEGPQLCFLGESRVNVLKLNLMLDSLDSP